MIEGIGVGLAEAVRGMQDLQEAARMATVDLSSLAAAYRNLYDGAELVARAPLRPTWAGRCGLCKRLVLRDDTNPNVETAAVCAPRDALMKWCCVGTAMLLPDWQSVLAAFCLGGPEALEPWR